MINYTDIDWNLIYVDKYFYSNNIIVIVRPNNDDKKGHIPTNTQLYTHTHANSIFKAKYLLMRNQQFRGGWIGGWISSGSKGEGG